MKEMLLALFLFGLVPGVSIADTGTVNTPKSEKGEEVHPFYGGYRYKRITGTTDTLICSGNCVLAELIMGTGPATSSLRLRDTLTADGTADNAATVMILQFRGADTAGTVQKINRPLRSTYGWAGKLNAGANGTEEVIAVYLPVGPAN